MAACHVVGQDDTGSAGEGSAALICLCTMCSQRL